ncbi:MAG: ATP-binding protein [Bacteroidota bacterium]
MFTRYYQQQFDHWSQADKVIVLYGPRQVGKTTLVNTYCDQFSGKVFRGTGEDEQLQKLISSPSVDRLKTYFEDYDLLFIDEAQMIPDVGVGLKVITDQIPGLRLIVTGSSSFELSNRVGEPLVGRQEVYQLFPMSLLELKTHWGWYDTKNKLDQYLIYGLYPEVLTQTNRVDKINYLHQLKNSYLYKDILVLENIRNANKLQDLLKLLAFQIGHEVSHQELGKQLGMSKNTVARYLDLLEKAFVLINVRGFSRNLRKEISKTSRYYFYDLGVRNALINNFNDLDTRNDVSQLWENFVFVERLKKRAYHRIHANYYFWRTYDQKEIDLVEERDGQLYGYEMKYAPNNSKPPKEWLSTYSNASYQTIHRENLEDYIL